MTTLISNDNAEFILTHNMQDWKKEVSNIQEVLDVNGILDLDDIPVIVSPEFYDDMNSDLDVADVLDKHYMYHLNASRNTFIALHNLYNN